jgi:pimeloyl-ACP methyl ester carboxylesterase
MPPSQPGSQPSQNDDGFVLLHGAMLGRWIWERVDPRLASPALALDFPGRGVKPADVTTVKLRDVIDSVVADIDSWPIKRLVLVAHSLSGIVIPAVISRFPQRVTGVVFLSASVPKSGASYLDALPRLQRMFLRIALSTQRKRGLLSPMWATRRSLCNDLDEGTTALVIDNLSREPPGIYTDPIPGEIPASVPTVYIKLTSDHAFSPRLQDQMIARLHDPHIEEMDAGHLPMLGHPDELAAAFNSVVERFRDAG